MRTLAAFLILAAPIGTAPALAAVRLVPQQYPSIAAAEAAASSGDVIKIAPGRYQESVATAKSLRFVGSKETIWDGFYAGTDHAQLVANAANVEVVNIEFQNGSSFGVEIVGANGLVRDCVFRTVYNGVSITGTNAGVIDNEFIGQQGTSDTIVIVGPDAEIRDNGIREGNGSWITVDALGAGGATVSGNVSDTNSYYAVLLVSNASAPEVRNNRIRNTYADDAVIQVVNCNDAVVAGNELFNINYYVTEGIEVTGDRAEVVKNVLDSLNCYNDEIRCIRVAGADAVVRQNEIRNCGAGNDYDTWGVLVDGNDARVEKNLVADLNGGGDETFGIEVNGNDAVVASNKVLYLNDEYTYSIYLVGDRAVVRKNKLCGGMYEVLLQLTGDDFSIENNTLKDATYSAVGLVVNGGATAPGAAVIRGNKLKNIVDSAFGLTGNGVIVQNNLVQHAAGTGIEISGDGNELKGNRARDTGDDGFSIAGANNSVENCKAEKCGRDGFDVAGAGNQFDECEATDCVAEGFDNGGTATVVTKCTLKKSRIDYAGNSNIANDAGTTYQTGGPGTAPEID